MSLTRLLVPTYSQMLKALSGWLQKAKEQIPHAESLLSNRLAPDMYPLATQIRFACLQSQEAVARLSENALRESLDQLTREGVQAAEKPGSLSDAHVRIDETLALLGDLGPDTLDASAEKVITLELPTGTIFEMTGADYARDWALPQFYFHLMTAYAILRNQGIELGKADYVPHMSTYRRSNPTA